METNGLSMFQILDDIENPTYKEVGEIKKKVLDCLSETEKQEYENLEGIRKERYIRNKFLYIMNRGNI